MFTNMKMAFGAAHTLFWTVTPAAEVGLWGALGWFRLGVGVAGTAGWAFATSEGDPEGRLIANDMPGGFATPASLAATKGTQ